MTTTRMDRRTRPRRGEDLPQGIKLIVPTQVGRMRTLAAKLVDASEEGIGVETYVPLTVGELVLLEGDLRHSDLALSLRGHARVVHSTHEIDGNFRCGLVFERVAYSRSA